MSHVKVLAFALVGALAAACSDTPTAPTRAGEASGLAGTWFGSITDSINGAGALRVTLREVGTANGITAFDGSWSTTFSNAGDNRAGQAIATVTAGSPSLSLLPHPPPTCPEFAFSSRGAYTTLSLSVSSTTLRGTYAYSSCSVAVTGTLELRRQ